METFKYRINGMQSNGIRVKGIKVGPSFVGLFLVCLVATNGLENISQTGIQNGLFLESDLTFKAIQKTLAYFLRNPSFVCVDDVQFGVLLAKLNLQWIFDRIQSRFGYDHAVINKKLSAMMKMTNEILKFNNRTKISTLLHQNYMTIGAEDIDYVSLEVFNSRFPKVEFDSCREIENYLMRKSSDSSDECIEELYKRQCNASNDCWLFEMGNQVSDSGYKTSHRLIYLQAASKLRCEAIDDRFFDLKKQKRNLCERMLLEAKFIYNHTNFLAIQDLFLEQIALCGFEGFYEFGPIQWREKVRNWQSENGCFGQNAIAVDCSRMAGDSSEESKSLKKTDLIVNEDCNVHVTAVALAAMAFHLRLILHLSSFTIVPFF